MKTERYLIHPDMELLGRLAEKFMRTEDELHLGKMLADVLSHSTVLPVGAHMEHCVAMYSAVRYAQVGRLDERCIIIVSPLEAGCHMAFASILSPIGLALIGKALHSVVEVGMPLGHVDRVEIRGVLHYRKMHEVRRMRVQ